MANGTLLSQAPLSTIVVSSRHSSLVLVKTRESRPSGYRSPVSTPNGRSISMGLIRVQSGILAANVSYDYLLRSRIEVPLALG
jgi:hypothetical protein